ncbi:family 16 glycosylhydrolase [Coraliomargarita sp. SDUM461003]|uniref:Family 16 glycosylhydrolase n=1 Tax=Thalassobacterium maritimum TaxID=3041265 RepID=A0ABU1AZJ9_9BACT|nr:DNRLRE domain-containing protein [Coraliomargarita sp. SDUM461003]MDQ8208689.1 family 16 glycosylhydrolase [Coraliomargarita sp. SDUM461003]
MPLKKTSCPQFILRALLTACVCSEVHAAEIILDNAAPSGVTSTGTWTTGNYSSDRYGADYLHDSNTSKGAKSVLFAPTLPSSDSYEVYAIWSEHANRASNVPIDITHSSGIDYVEVNQQANGGEWVLLGTYPFDAGNSGTVRIGNELTNGYVIADAVRFVTAPEPVEPVPSIEGDWELTFEDNFDGTALDGNKWRFATTYAGMPGSGGNNHKNVTVADGYLNLKASTDSGSIGGSSYSNSGCQVSTYDVYRQQYGYFEARIKYPAVKGLWPAFWMMPDRANYGWLEGYYRSYLKFDLSNASPGTITSAVLKLKASAIKTQGSVPNNLVYMKLRDDSWNESTLTWNNKPAADPVWIEQKWGEINTVGQEVTLDITDFVSEQMDDDKIISIVLADTFMRNRSVKFHSKEAANQADRPQLIINGVTYYVSEDAHVSRGSYADTNFGSATENFVSDSYGSGTHTYGDGMEIDIMESLGIWGQDTTQHATHWDGYGSQHQHTNWGKITYPATTDDFHTYGVYWQDDLLEFYIDGRKTAEWSNSRIPSAPAFMILSMQLGGWDNNGVTDLIDDQVMQVDWVRAWTGTRTPITISELIIDNTDSSQVSQTGTWSSSSTNNGYYGSNYSHDGNTDKGNKSFNYQIDVPLSGTYWVYARWTSYTNRATNVPIDLTGSDGTTTVTVNQQEDGGKWVLLGEKEFDAATTGSVEIRTDGTDGYVIADGIRLLRVGN